MMRWCAYEHKQCTVEICVFPEANTHTQPCIISQQQRTKKCTHAIKRIAEHFSVVQLCAFFSFACSFGWAAAWVAFTNTHTRTYDKSKLRGLTRLSYKYTPYLHSRETPAWTARFIQRGQFAMCAAWHDERRRRRLQQQPVQRILCLLFACTRASLCCARQWLHIRQHRIPALLSWRYRRRCSRRCRCRRIKL